MTDSQSGGWSIAIRVLVEGESEWHAQRALEAIERAAKRAPAEVNVYVEESGEVVR